MFSKMQKSVVFFGFKALIGWVGFGFCGLILSFAAFRECKSFLLVLKKQVAREIIELLLVTPTLACSKNVRFYLISGARMTFREIERFVLGG